MPILATINAFWVGPTLSKLHASCLQSFVRQGHRVTLHAYEKVQGVPKGVELADADKTLSREKIVKHTKTGSLALASDIFRYELFASDAGIYVDCDCYCVRPVPDGDVILGLETDGVLGTAVLKLPVDHPALLAMRSIATSRGFIPPWEKTRRRQFYRLRSALGAPVSISNMRWGTMGPLALTHYAHQHEIFDQARPIDVYFPLSYSHIALLSDPGLKVDDITTPRTCVIHLWDEFLRKNGVRSVAGSPLEQIINSIET